MKAIVAGGSGFIGGALVRSLAADGHEVVVLSRRPAAVRDLPAGARAVGWDGRTVGEWARELEGAGAVVQLSGESLSDGRWTEAKKERLRASRVDSGAALTDAVAGLRTPPRVLVQGSAVGYYGPRGDEEIAEDAISGNDFLARLCLAWEASTAGVEARGVRRPIARTGVVLDPGEGALAKMLPPFRLGAGGRLGSGRQWFPWIHRDDEVAALRLLVDDERAQGPFNLTAPAPVRNGELTGDLGRALRRPTVFPVPAPALRLLFGEMADVLLTGQRAVPRKLLELGFRFRFAQLDAALADLLAPPR